MASIDTHVRTGYEMVASATVFNDFIGMRFSVRDREERMVDEVTFLIAGKTDAAMKLRKVAQELLHKAEAIEANLGRDFVRPPITEAPGLPHEMIDREHARQDRDADLIDRKISETTKRLNQSLKGAE